ERGHRKFPSAPLKSLARLFDGNRGSITLRCGNMPDHPAAFQNTHHTRLLALGERAHLLWRIEQAGTQSLEDSFLARPTAVERYGARREGKRLHVGLLAGRKVMPDRSLPKNAGAHMLHIDSNGIV